MNTQSAHRHWFVWHNGKRHGPFTFAALAKAARDGVISAETKIWRQGWQKWHPARQVRGLLNEAPLAPDDTEWMDEQARAPTEEALLYAPQRRDGRRSQDVVTLRWEQPPVEDKTDLIFADEWRMLAERPSQDRANPRTANPRTANPRASAWSGRKTTATAIDVTDADPGDAEYQPVVGTETADRAPFAARFRRFLRRMAIGACAILLALAAGWWAVSEPGLIPSLKFAPAAPRSALLASPGDLPASVASLPAIATLQRNDPAAFERFKKRYADSALNAQDDEVMSLARAALRKSVKHLLAISSGDVLLEITETSLAYMQGLQPANPESCVALSDESKGARLTSNLAKELPMVFVREMSALERIAGTNPHTAIAPMSAEEARPYFERVASTLQRQSVKTDLQARERLDPSEFTSYCALVIAFYQAVLDLPRDDKINLLRYLYATAAMGADKDLAR